MKGAAEMYRAFAGGAMGGCGGRGCGALSWNDDSHLSVQGRRDGSGISRDTKISPGECDR